MGDQKDTAQYSSADSPLKVRSGTARSQHYFSTFVGAIVSARLNTAEAFTDAASTVRGDSGELPRVRAVRLQNRWHSYQILHTEPQTSHET